MMTLSASAQLLETLVAFDTTSYKSNLQLIRYVQSLLEEAGAEVELVFDDAENKANLFAATGPRDRAGVILSGHTDVVPVEGQAWGTEPFKATLKDGLLYGRGTADMKGFVACAVIAFLQAARQPLQKPLYLCLSYDEEIGCIGVRSLLDVLKHTMVPPELCIIGEPTLMGIATGHKGKAVYRAVCLGEEGHSAHAPRFANAVHAACDLVDGIRGVQQWLSENGARDDAYDIPYTTVHVGKIAGGKALNIVPNECVVDFEIRHLAQEDPGSLIEEIGARLDEKNGDAARRVTIDETNRYPGLDMPETVDAVCFLQECLPDDTAVGKIAFGTEGGLFVGALGCPVLVCGPGSISVAHKPDEYVSLEQLDLCDTFLQQVVRRLS